MSLMRVRQVICFVLLAICIGLTGCTIGNHGSMGDVSGLSDLEQEVHSLINKERAKNGLRNLAMDERIAKQARIHSNNMANGSVAFGHDGFEARVEATGIPYVKAGENVAWNSYEANTAQVAVEGWMNSAGHRKNILTPEYDLTGIGVVEKGGKYYYTQIFMKKK